jgi:cytochrome P450
MRVTVPIDKCNGKETMMSDDTDAAFGLDSARMAQNLAGNRLPQFDPVLDVAADPYAIYARYREQDPVHWGLPNDPRYGGLWYLFAHEDCNQLFRIGLETPCPIGGMPSKVGWSFGAGAPAEAQDYFEMRARFLTAQDPPDHTRVRGAISQWFKPQRIEECKPRIDELLDGLLDDVEASGTGHFDFVEQVAYPLPLLVISELMGVPVEDRELVHEMSSGLGAGFDVDGTWEPVLRAAEAARRFRRYLAPVFADHRAHRRDDIIGHMIDAADQEGSLSELDLYATVSILIQGGQSTTMALLGRGLQGLLQQRDQWDLLVDDPDGASFTATEELLRYTAPAQRPPPRWVYEDIELGGRLIRRGEAIQPMVGSANRDPAVFSDPERIDILRSPNPHLGFGGGVHRCVGSTLARVQGRAVFAALAKRFPKLRLDEQAELRYLNRLAVRALTTLPVYTS